MGAAILDVDLLAFERGGQAARSAVVDGVIMGEDEGTLVHA